MDQILTGPWFELKATRGRNFEIAEGEYQDLLDVQAAGKLSPEGKQRLAKLKVWINEHQSPPGETPEESEVYDMAESLIDLLDEYLPDRG